MSKYFDLLTIKIFDFIYRLQEKKHAKRMEKIKQDILLKNKNNKRHAISGTTLTIENNEDKIHQQKVERIIEKYINEPEKFFEFIKGAKTPIYKIKFAPQILAKIGENEGFILPQKGLKALYLNLILNKKIDFKTTEMFVLRNYNVNIYAFIYQFYNWYCYKMNLSGYDNETQEKFKHVFEICETNKIDSLTYDEILNLKSAIKRDIEAIDFVKKMTQKFMMSKKNLEKIKQGQSVNI